MEDEYSSRGGNTKRGSDSSWDDDELLLGEGLNEPKAYSLDIQYSNLSLTVSGGGPTVLKGVSGQIKPGRVTAIMGPSGAGKSSFLGAVTGKASSYGTITGSLMINGKSRQLKNFDTECGFVPQDDTMHRDLRVREVTSTLNPHPHPHPHPTLTITLTITPNQRTRCTETSEYAR